MALIGKFVILCAAVAFGYLAAKGDVSCRMAPGALQDLKGAVSSTVRQWTGGIQWTTQDGSGNVSFTLPQPGWDTGGYAAAGRETRDPTPLGAR